MGTLLVSLEPSETIPPSTPVAVDIRDRDMRLHTSFALAADDARTIDLAGGEYVIIAALPGGEQLEAIGDVPESDSASIRFLCPPEVSRTAAAAASRSARHAARRILAAVGVRHTLTLWVRENGRWTVRRTEQLDGCERRVILTAVGEGLCALQLSNPIGGSCFSLVPPLTVVEVQAQSEVWEAVRAPQIRFSDSLASSLDAYLAEGQTRHASVLMRDPQLLERAEVEVAASLLAGYTLLRGSEADALAAWRGRMSRPGHALVADDHVILGWLLLRADEPQMAIAELLRAEAIGPPLYTYGLRLLLDGLELFACESTDDSEDAHLARSALLRLDRYASTVAWSQRITTFPGREPGSPCRTPRRPNVEQLRSARHEPRDVAAILLVLSAAGAVGQRRLGSARGGAWRRPYRVTRKRRRRLSLALLFAAAVALSPELRGRLLDALFGSEESFDFESQSLGRENDPERQRYASA